jgi:hypothetical protein
MDQQTNKQVNDQRTNNTMTIEKYKARLERRKQAKYKAIAYNPEWTPNYNKTDRYRWVENPRDGLRFVGSAHDKNPTIHCEDWPNRLIDHKGWYTDPYNDGETVCGQVYQLPTRRNGSVAYLPAISDPFNEASVIDFHSATSDIREAILWSDQMAERYAEQEREDNAKTMAEDRIAENKTAIETLYVDFKALCRELRANCDKVSGLPELRKLIHREYRAVRSKARALRAEIAKLENDYWSVIR